MNNLIVNACAGENTIKILGLIIQAITALTAIILPIYTINKTIEANETQLILKDKIEKKNILFGLLSEWYIEGIRITDCITKNISVNSDVINNLFIQVSKNKLYQNQNDDFRRNFLNLRNSTSELIRGKTEKINEIIDSITNLQNLLSKEELK